MDPAIVFFLLGLLAVAAATVVFCKTDPSNK